MKRYHKKEWAADFFLQRGRTGYHRQDHRHPEATRVQSQGELPLAARRAYRLCYLRLEQRR